MVRKMLSLLMMSSLLNLSGIAATCILAYENNGESVSEVRDAVRNFGTGKDAQLEVRLKNTTKLKGYIKEVRTASFILVYTAAGKSAEIAYSDVKEIKGKNLSTGKKIAIGVGVSLGVLFLIWVLISTSD